MPSNLQEQVKQKTAIFLETVENKHDACSHARTPADFRAMELDVAATCRDLGDELTASVLFDTVADPAFQLQTSVAARQGGKLRGSSSNGTEIPCYCAPCHYLHTIANAAQVCFEAKVALWGTMTRDKQHGWGGTHQP